MACSFGAKATHKISYTFKDPAFQTFTLANVMDPENGEWQVYGNGVQIKDFTREGATVTITPPLSGGATVVLGFVPNVT